MEERIQLCDDNLDEKCLEKVESADEVSKLLSQEVFRLQELYAKCAKIYRWMLEIHLIEKNGENLVDPI
ncbi:hypothetical protein Glove_256g36 [Diversispora epigaea]|uniref:Uncharacterized protein n=1 Tax=Diversispora epigaea TaxID=1348612 RepID=A0A397IE37_9GLOM|nr:hypothetical protein Glove_256g36 [Diversispora epigaea]